MIRFACVPLAVTAWLFFAQPCEMQGCCAVAPPGKPIVNADQTVILIWDPETKTEHFIRRASFQSSANKFGFLVPTPAEPELAESDLSAFTQLEKLTAPEVVTQRQPFHCGLGCGGMSAPRQAKGDSVRISQDVFVAGFRARVLQADSEQALVEWLRANDFTYSAAVADWARPYIGKKWKFTALQIAAPKDPEPAASSSRASSKNVKDALASANVTAKALRISFRAEQPLFPYREPRSDSDAKQLQIDHRLLRIYFIGDQRYDGSLGVKQAWSGQMVWSGALTAESKQALAEALGLARASGPERWWLTEFEDDWAYREAPADLTFEPSANQQPVKRPPIIHYADTAPAAGHAVAACLPAALALSFLAFTRFRRRKL